MLVGGGGGGCCSCDVQFFTLLCMVYNGLCANII